MKIKYIEKFHKKIKEDYHFQDKCLAASVAAVLLVLSIPISVYAKNYVEDVHIANEIKGISYIVEEDKSYKLEDIFILYKNDEIRKCRREEVLLSEQLKLNPALFILLGPAGSATYDRDYIYNFYDIETNELIACTTFSNLMCEDINAFDLETNESIGYKEGQVPEASMNGYKFINLGEVIGQYGISDYKSIDQEYVDDFIEGKKFLSR